MVSLNVGCGPLALPGEIGVDREPTAAVEVRGDALALPFRDGCAEFVRLDHVLEHLPVRKAVSVLLEARRVMAPGGTLRVGVPDLAETCRAYLDAAGDIQEKALLLRSLFGSQIHEGEYHRSGWDQETLADLLTAAGFQEVVVEEEMRDEGYCLRAEAVM